MIGATQEMSVEANVALRNSPRPPPARPALSVVCTVYNEEEVIPELLDKLALVLSTLEISSEIIMVDDGSTDRTLARLKSMIGHAPALRIVELYRNYGQVAALGAGMSVARGDWIVMLDGDLQHDPQDIRRLVAEIANGHDLVATYRDRREETNFRLAVTWVGNRVNRYLTGERIRDFGSAYRLFSARLLDMMTDGFGYVHYNTPALYINSRSGVELPITQFRRRYGASKWNLISLIQYNLDFLIHSKKITQVLLTIGMLGMFIGAALYVSSLSGFAEPARDYGTNQHRVYFVSGDAAGGDLARGDANPTVRSWATALFDCRNLAGLRRWFTQPGERTPPSVCQVRDHCFRLTKACCLREDWALDVLHNQCPRGFRVVDDRPDNSSRSIALAFTGVSEQALRRLIPDTDGDAPWRPKISGKAQSVSMKPLKQESQVERRPAGCKKAVVCVNEGVDNPEQWRVVTRRAYDRHYTRTRARCLDGLPRRAASVLGVCLDYTLEEPGPICFCQPCERFAKLDTVDQAEARVPSPIYKFFFAHEPVMPVPERPDAYMRPDAREHPIERIVGQRKARTRTSEDNMTTASHNPRELAEARPRVGDVFDHLEAAHDIETRIIERQLLGVRDEVLYPRHIRVESTRMRNVTLVEVACDKIARRLAEVAVDIPSPQPTLIMRPISAARPTRSSVRSTQRWRAR